MLHYAVGSSLPDQLTGHFECLAGKRSPQESLWRQTTELLLPGEPADFSARGRFWYSPDLRSDIIFDSKPVIAADRCVSMVESFLTPRNQPGLRFDPEDPRLIKDRATVRFLDDMAGTVLHYRYSPDANFTSQNRQVIKSLVYYGTGVMFIDAARGKVGTRYRAIHLSEIFFDVDHEGRINRAFRIFVLTARQAAMLALSPNPLERWKLPEKIAKAAVEKPDQEFRFLHCVVPREDRSLLRADYKGMPWASYYLALDCKEIVHESGYTSFPYAVARWDVGPGGIYGRSKAGNLVPSFRMLNEVKKAEIKQAHRAVDPVILAFDDDTIDGFDMEPGAINYGAIDAEGNLRVQTLPIGKPGGGRDLVADEHDTIADGFDLKLFQILIDRKTEMTELETQFRENEKNFFMLPPIVRQQDEYLAPMSIREVDVLAPFRVFGTPPPALRTQPGQRAGYRVRYETPAAAAQRAGEALGVMRAAKFLSGLAGETGDQRFRDWLDPDEIGQNLPVMLGSTGRYIRTLDEVNRIGAERAKAAEERAMTEAAPAAAGLISAGAKIAGGGPGGPIG